MIGELGGRSSTALLLHSALIQAVTFLVRPAATYRALELDVPAFALGVLAASYAVFPLLLALPIGSLVDRLGYRVPEMLDALVSEEMARLGIDGFARALDLGCGTGLMGQHLRGKTAYLEGIDVSAAMIAETARKGIYDSLQKAELVAALNTRRADADLVTAADVFIYCGALPPVLAALVPALKPGGLVAFSLEAHDGPEPLFLRPSLRYAHGLDATRDALVVAGLEVLRFETAVLRFDRGAPITGMLVVARRPPLELTAANDGQDGGNVAA